MKSSFQEEDAQFDQNNCGFIIVSPDIHAASRHHSLLKSISCVVVTLCMKSEIVHNMTISWPISSWQSGFCKLAIFNICFWNMWIKCPRNKGSFSTKRQHYVTVYGVCVMRFIKSILVQASLLVSACHKNISLLFHYLFTVNLLHNYPDSLMYFFFLFRYPVEPKSYNV